MNRVKILLQNSKKVFLKMIFNFDFYKLESIQVHQSFNTQVMQVFFLLLVLPDK